MEPNEAMKAMARRVAASCVAQSDGRIMNRSQRDILEGRCDDWHGVRSALAAIMETQRLDAELVAEWPAKVLDCEPALFCDGSRWTATHVASRIRAGEHYAMSAALGTDIGGERD